MNFHFQGKKKNPNFIVFLELKYHEIHSFSLIKSIVKTSSKII